MTTEQWTYNPSRIDNLKQWTEGKSGNPSGRPKITIVGELRKILEEYDVDAGKTKAEIVAHKMYDKAMDDKSRGQVPVLLEILNRIDGKVADRHINATITVTPENLEQARSLILNDKAEETLLLQEYTDV